MVFKENKTIDGEHGRVEERTYTFLPMMYLLAFGHIWKDLQTIIRVESHTYSGGEEKATTTRYFITSLGWKQTEKITEAIRSHWHIENRLHWCLDVVFKEDANRIRPGYADQNLWALRKLVLNLLRRDNIFKGGLQMKRSYTAWNNDYLQQVLGL